MTRHSSTFRFILGFTSIIALLLLMLLPTLAQRRISRPGKWEGEHLVNSGKVTVNGGSVAVQRMTGFGDGWSGDSHLFWGGGQVGAVLDLTIDIGEEGIYEVELHMTRAPDFGRLRIQVDGKDAAEAFDGYAPTVVPSGPVKLGSFDLNVGPRKVSFMIEGKNPNSSNFYAGIDFLRLNRVPTAASKTQSALEPSPKWQIGAMALPTDPTETGLDGQKATAYKEGQVITVKCSYEPIVPGKARLRIRDRWVGNNWEWIRHDIAITQAGTQTTSFAVSGSGKHLFLCDVTVFNDPPQPPYYPHEPNWTLLSKGELPFQVVAGIVPSQTKWPTAPIIQTPINNGKIVVLPYNPSSSHCADGGVISFEWQYLKNATPPPVWAPLKMMLKPLACVPAGATKDMSGLNPGLYRVRAKEINGKHPFESDWSDWVAFQIPNK